VIESVTRGLRRWTAYHEEWREPVASVAVETDDGLVLIDPLDPPRGLARPDHVLLTIYWHIRSAPELTANEVWSSRRAARPLKNRGLQVTQTVEDGRLPGGIRAFPTARNGEVVYWLPHQKSVVAGDVLLGAGAKPNATNEPLRLCPEGWLGKASHDDLRDSLRPLLDLPVQRVLVSHGEPVLRAGRRALAAVLA
jgi:glyoxylase-like metal-dependent hydrolase (beta-lactamase superfamily II)